MRIKNLVFGGMLGLVFLSALCVGRGGESEKFPWVEEYRFERVWRGRISDPAIIYGHLAFIQIASPLDDKGDRFNLTGVIDRTRASSPAARLRDKEFKVGDEVFFVTVSTTGHPFLGSPNIFSCMAFIIPKPLDDTIVVNPSK